MSALVELLSRVGAVVLERGWLSSNSVLFAESRGPATVVDTGYATHAAQTVMLLDQALGGRPLRRILNTHLHSDHCGGNAALQARFGCAVHVPQASYLAAVAWDQSRLTFRATGQRCGRFRVDGAVVPGSTVRLGGLSWEVHACGGHDPDAAMFFEPQHRILISGDALWEYRVPIAFEALLDPRGIDSSLATIRLIESLRPEVVIPGHGAPFGDVSGAVTRTRRRLEAFASGRADHLESARRALTMFHFLEYRQRTFKQLIDWANSVTVFGDENPHWVESTAAALVSQGLLRHADKTRLVLPSG